MRHVIFLDSKIPQRQYKAWEKADAEFWEEFGLTNKYWVIRKDFSTYPTFIDEDGDVRPTASYLRALSEEVFADYKEYGTDFIIMLVHEDNWRSAGPLFDQLRAEASLPPKRGIWGSNFSNVFRSYHLQYCRWDKDNTANVFGTMYHERAHAFDVLIKTETGKDVNEVIGTKHYDREFVHGEGDRFDYIGRTNGRENTLYLAKFAPLLRDACVNRISLHIKYIQGRITLWQALLRKVTLLLNRKEGVDKSLEPSR